MNRLIALFLASSIILGTTAEGAEAAHPFDGHPWRETHAPYFTQEAFASQATQFISSIARHPEAKVVCLQLAHATLGWVASHFGHPWLGYGMFGMAMVPPGGIRNGSREPAANGNHTLKLDDKWKGIDGGQTLSRPLTETQLANIPDWRSILRQGLAQFQMKGWPRLVPLMNTFENADVTIAVGASKAQDASEASAWRSERANLYLFGYLLQEIVAPSENTQAWREKETKGVPGYTYVLSFSSPLGPVEAALHFGDDPSVPRLEIQIKVETAKGEWHVFEGIRVGMDYILRILHLDIGPLGIGAVSWVHRASLETAFFKKDTKRTERASVFWEFMQMIKDRIVAMSNFYDPAPENRGFYHLLNWQVTPKTASSAEPAKISGSSKPRSQTVEASAPIVYGENDVLALRQILRHEVKPRTRFERVPSGNLLWLLQHPDPSIEQVRQHCLPMVPLRKW